MQPEISQNARNRTRIIMRTNSEMLERNTATNLCQVKWGGNDHKQGSAAHVCV